MRLPARPRTELLPEVAARVNLERRRDETRDGFELRCPAGVPLSERGRPACFCRIEQHVIGSAEASTLKLYCGGSYTECPTWRADKETTWRKRDGGVAAA